MLDTPYAFQIAVAIAPILYFQGDGDVRMLNPAIIVRDSHAGHSSCLPRYCAHAHPVLAGRCADPEPCHHRGTAP
eukprot:257761-Pelagomonas_calceolata.AAC.1